MKTNDADKITSQLIDLFIKHRKQQGLSHEKVAKLTGLHRSSISLIESKKRSPTFKNCLLIASALGLQLNNLLKEVES